MTYFQHVIIHKCAEAVNTSKVHCSILSVSVYVHCTLRGIFLAGWVRSVLNDRSHFATCEIKLYIYKDSMDKISVMNGPVTMALSTVVR